MTAVFDPYCDRCLAPFTVRWRPMHELMLCDDCAPEMAVLCESCSQNVAAVIVDGFKTCGSCALAKGPLL